MSQYGKGISNSGPGGFIQTLTGNSGGPVSPTAGNINVVGTGVITVVGDPGTSTLTVGITGTTNHAVQVGNAAGGLTSIPVGLTGQVLTGVTGADPVFAAPAASAITITGDSGGPLGPSNSFTFTGGTTNGTALFAGAGTTETLTFSDADFNTVLGDTAFKTIHTPAVGVANTGLGWHALNAVTTGSGNTGLGFNALTSIDAGINNVALGANTLGSATSADGNIALGSALTALLTGDDNIAIGNSAGGSYTGAESDNIVIGSTGVIADNAKIRIGTNGTQTATFIVGIDGVNVGSVAKVVTMASDQLGTATITAGTGITVTPGANTITIASSSTAFVWSVITANQTAAVNNGYFCNKAGTLALALPAASAVGDVIEVTNENTALGIQFTQAAGQQILIGNTNTTLGATGTLTSSAVGDTLKIVCKVANTIWRVTSGWGNWTPA